MHEQEFAQLVLKKARQDEFILRKLIDDPDSPDEGIGFHAQQAVEKFIKAVLIVHRVKYPRTHDLAALTLLLKKQGIPYPECLDNALELTPYAVEFRYDIVPLEGESHLDRSFVLKTVEKTGAWAENSIRTLPE